MTGPTVHPGTLFVVGTPIGNLDDLSPRAVSTLRDCRVIAAEDTRKTRGLLTRHAINSRLISCHRFNESRVAGKILAMLAEGDGVALVTDAGTPGLSDPGALLVRRAREAGFEVRPVPGASAVTALMSVCGFPAGPFTFVGFLPARQGARQRMLEQLRDETRPLLFFESSRRIQAMLADAQAILGDREVCLGREMTKLHEEFLTGTLSRIGDLLAERLLKGEISLVIAGQDPDVTAERARNDTSGESPGNAVLRHIDSGVTRKEAIRQVCRQFGLPRREVYRDLVRVRGIPSEDENG
ncbi:MAG: 16S rRNA (cytidine(1402)-2'-O)-methyltransferase [Acidobacteria bacterium]|nr:16S rRNA (cytidine(1402)-2'-O)-methyltransferase [Acidobacteriota bacterium]